MAKKITQNKHLCIGSYVRVMTSCAVSSEGFDSFCERILLSLCKDEDKELSFSYKLGKRRISYDSSNFNKIQLSYQKLPKAIVNMAINKDPQNIKCYFTKNIIPRIDEAKKGNLVLALKDIILKDKYISDNDQLGPITSLTKEDLRNKNDFVLPDFLTDVFIYAVTKTDNTVESTFTKSIDKNFYKKYNQNLHTIKIIKETEGSVSQPSADSNKTASESTDQPRRFWISEDTPLTSIYAYYLHEAHEKYHLIKPLVYNGAKVEFNSFYVCNTINRRVKSKHGILGVYEPNVTADRLKMHSNLISISALGGAGKSMMMRHLLLEAIDSNFEKIPILIELRNYNPAKNDLLNYIFEKFNYLHGAETIEEFTELLENGSCLLLLDGMDEIKSRYIEKFISELTLLTNKYGNNMFIISSRPIHAFNYLENFEVFDLIPFNKEQAIEAVQKLNFKPETPEIKENFCKELENTLFDEYTPFAQNPLLLIIMLMTYGRLKKIPTVVYRFYEETYHTLFWKHDNTKGDYKRTLKTGLNVDQFADCLAEFAKLAYANEDFDFSSIQFDRYFNEIKAHNKNLTNISPADLKYDLINNTCLMIHEDGRYRFIHRSFQEYFCALYFSKQSGKQLKAAGAFFADAADRRPFYVIDNAFDLLYEMIPKEIDRYIFKPYLDKLFGSGNVYNDYFAFLQALYPIILCEVGYTDGFCWNYASSFIYAAITRLSPDIKAPNFDESDFRFYDIPGAEEFMVAEWTDQVPYSFCPVNIKRLPENYEEMYGIPDISGMSFEIRIDTILDTPSRYKKLCAFISQDKFPLKKEFIAAREYWQYLVNKYGAAEK